MPRKRTSRRQACINLIFLTLLGCRIPDMANQPRGCNRERHKIGRGRASSPRRLTARAQCLQTLSRIRRGSRRSGGVCRHREAGAGSDRPGTISTSKTSQGCGAVVILKRWRRRICGVNCTLDCFLQRCGQMACRPRPCLFNRRMSYEVGRKCSGEHWAVWAPESATKFLPDPASRGVPDRAFS